MTESWKDIEEWEGFYQVSNQGRVKSLRRTAPLRKVYLRIVSERILTPIDRRDGYLMVILRRTGQKGKCRLIHRLVAQAFLKNKRKKEEVNHKNGIKTDNRVGNLEWVTPKENVKHSFLIGTSKGSPGEENSQARLTANQVLQIRDLYARKEANQYQLADQFGVSQVQIARIVHKQSWRNI